MDKIGKKTKCIDEMLRQMSSEDFDPNRLLDHVAAKILAKNDRHLSEVLGVSASQISRLRRLDLHFTPKIIVAILDTVPDMSLAQLRELAGMPKSNFRGGLN